MGQPNNVIQTNFTAGEVSPRIRGQVQLKKYINGARTMQNMIVYAQGGATRRVGTLFANRVRSYLNSSSLVRVLPFIFSTTQNYILEIGDSYSQFYRLRGVVTNGGITITVATNASPCQITAPAHGFTTGDQVLFSGLRGLVFLNNQNLAVIVIDANNFTIAIDTTLDGAYIASSGNVAKIYSLATPWVSSDLVSLKYTQSADTLYVTSGNKSPRKLTRTSDNNWTITDMATLFLDGPYLNQNTTATTITPSAASGNITLTASTAIFAATDVNRVVRLFEGAAWGWCRITAFTSATVVSATVIGTNLAATVAVTAWRLGAFSDTTGWPQVVTFHQQRLVFGCTFSQPQTMFGSNTADFENMAPTKADGTILDSNGFVFTISDDQVNSIRSLSSGPVLFIGTSAAEYTMFSGGNNQYVPITASNVNIKRESTHGSAPNVRVKRIGNSIIYVQNSKRRVREAAYSYIVDGYLSTDITKYSEHITLSGVTDFDYQEEIDSIGWMTRKDGTLIGFTYDKDDSVLAWHRHIVGGAFTDPTIPGALPGQAVVESVAIIPDPTGTHGDLWAVVKRTINGQTVRSIEYSNDPFDPDTNGQRSGYFVDCGLSYNGYYNASLTPAAITGAGITFTASAAVFSIYDVGKQIRSGSARATVTAFTDSTHVVCTIVSNFPSINPITYPRWFMGAQNFSGAIQLEGQSSQVCADGAPLANVTPTNGKFSLDDFYGMVHVGLGNTAIVEQLPTENQSLGTSQGLIKRIHGASIYLYRSLGLKFGPRAGKLEQLPFRGSQDNMNAPPPLFTGIKRVAFPDGYENEPVVFLQQDQPLPMTVLFISQEQEIYG